MAFATDSETRDADLRQGADIAAAGLSLATPGDYFALLKPRVMILVVLTAMTGFALAPNPPHPVVAFASILAIAVGAGASGALNMWWDADIDRVMIRTRGRPIPAGRVTPQEALGFGLALSFGSVLLLSLAANLLAAGLLAFTIFFYAVIYSMWLKRSTPQNIVIGGAAGAFPPIIGEAAATGSVTLASVLLFLLIFLWTPPHFWALALHKTADYAKAGVPMMPNVAGGDRTRAQILLYTLIMAPVGVAPALIGAGGLVYGVVSVVAGLGMIALAVEVRRNREGEAALRSCQRLFGFSILYLFLLFATLLAERAFGLGGFRAGY